MSVPLVTPADLPASHAGARTRPRVWLRALSFAALALYGTDRWARLMTDPPGWRLFGLVGLAAGLAVLVPLVRHLADGLPWRAGRILAGLMATGLMLAALPVAGLRWEWVWHARVAVSARAIGSGLGSLGGVLVPYLGHEDPIRLVITLGAAVLLLDAAAALAFGPRGPGAPLGDGRRAAAALPLIALAVVPATLVRPGAPALQGLLLFGLLALFMWGERIPRDGAAAALGVAVVAGIAGAIAGPLLESGHPWVNYRAWAGTVTASGVESFDWNQSYGPLSWPARDRVVLLVRADRADYWKATDLTQFNGVDWVGGPPSEAGRVIQPQPPAAVRRRWTQPVNVTVDNLTTSEVIGGSGVTGRPWLAGGVEPGDVSGTWVADRALGPGDSYTVLTYSPRPSPADLSRVDAWSSYPWHALSAARTLTLPTGGTMQAPSVQRSQLTFPAFHAPVPSLVPSLLADSPYLRAFRLARRLAAASPSPYAFVLRVERYLDDGRFIYDQDTPSATLPLLAFLFHTRVGYCQQFSGAMALLLRMGGVPARVAAGFTSGRYDRSAGAWEVTDIDAHAWVEVWFPRYGWVRFDPTPATAPARGGSGASIGPNGSDFHRFGLSPAAARAAAQTQSRTTTTTTSAAAGARSAGHGGGGSASGSGWGWIVGGGLAAGLAAATLIGWALGRRRGDPLTELERALSRTGRPLPEATTLVALERRFHDSPQAAGYVRALRLARYGYPTEPPTPAGRRALRAELAAGLGLNGRLRALWALPPRLGRRPLHGG